MKSSTLPYSKIRILKAIKKALHTLGMKIEESSMSYGKISAIYGGSFLSFGNKIDIHVERKGKDKSVLKINSRSAVLIQVIDWGTNENIEENITTEVNFLLNK